MHDSSRYSLYILSSLVFISFFQQLQHVFNDSPMDERLELPSPFQALDEMLTSLGPMDNIPAGTDTVTDTVTGTVTGSGTGTDTDTARSPLTTTRVLYQNFEEVAAPRQQTRAQFNQYQRQRARTPMVLSLPPPPLPAPVQQIPPIQIPPPPPPSVQQIPSIQIPPPPPSVQQIPPPPPPVQQQMNFCSPVLTIEQSRALYPPTISHASLKESSEYARSNQRVNVHPNYQLSCGYAMGRFNGWNEGGGGRVLDAGVAGYLLKILTDDLQCAVEKKKKLEYHLAHPHPMGPAYQWAADVAREVVLKQIQQADAVLAQCEARLAEFKKFC